MSDFNEALAQRLRMLDARTPTWKHARLTTFYPDAPPSQRKLEGGPLARGRYPILTAEQHLSDPVKYPFIVVAADLELEGKTLRPGFGPRIHFRAWPTWVFRIFDTGGAFYGKGKRIRDADYEPFDIATNYSGTLRTSIAKQKHTMYRIDWIDILEYPKQLMNLRRTEPLVS